MDGHHWPSLKPPDQWSALLLLRCFGVLATVVTAITNEAMTSMDALLLARTLDASWPSCSAT